MSYLTGLLERQRTRETGTIARRYGRDQLPRGELGVGRAGSDEFLPSSERYLDGGGARLGGGGGEWYDQPDPFRYGGATGPFQSTAFVNPITGKPIHPGVGVMPADRVALQVPVWASGEFDDPRVFYDWWNGMTPEEQGRARAALSAGHVARQRTEEARASGISELRGAQTRLGGRYETFMEDPRWQTIFDTLEGYASGESPMISPEELTLARLGLSQRYAQTEAAARGSAAGRGVGTSGNIGQLLDPMKVYTDVGGLQLAAQARAENRAGEMRATTDLARMLGSREGVALAYESELDRLTGAIAAIEAGKEYEPTDLLAFDELAWAMNAWEDEMERAANMEARYEEEAKWGGEDLINLFLQITGGFPGATAGLFS